MFHGKWLELCTLKPWTIRFKITKVGGKIQLRQFMIIIMPNDRFVLSNEGETLGQFF